MLFHTRCNYLNVCSRGIKSDTSFNTNVKQLYKMDRILAIVHSPKLLEKRELWEQCTHRNNFGRLEKVKRNSWQSHVINKLVKVKRIWINICTMSPSFEKYINYQTWVNSYIQFANWPELYCYVFTFKDFASCLHDFLRNDEVYNH